MAESAQPFDLNVFDAGVFDSLEVTPVVIKVGVPDAMYYADGGQVVSVFAYIFNVETTPGRSFPFSPPTPPQAEVYDPFDVIDVPFTNMVEKSTGVYLYQYTVPLNPLPGPYSVRIQTFNGSKSTLTRKMQICRVPGER